MPGPGGSHGGGARGGGGGFSGGFGGGGHRGGGFGGGHRPPPRGFYGGWGWGRPYRYGYGGGCLGGLLGMIMLPIFILIFAVILIFSSFSNAFYSLSQGGEVYYDSEKFMDYADAQYAAEFGSSKAYEDHILLVFAVDDVNYYDFAYIA